MIKYISRFLVEAATPLFVGSGQSSLLKDALVQKDANGFPMILGTSLAGVLRHSLWKMKDEHFVNTIFGSSNNANNSGSGSLLKVSPALMVLDKYTLSEGLLFEDRWNHVKFRFNNLPLRQHVRITHEGVAEKNGLFDNEVIFKGTQFVFELEMTDSKGMLESQWEEILNCVQSPDFRIGAGTRNGYGSLKVLKIQNSRFDLGTQMDSYLNYSPALASTDWTQINLINTDLGFSNGTKTHYQLELLPDPFFIFGSGFGDSEVDNVPVEEDVIVYTEKGIDFEKQTRVPGSSVKGAISHRVAYHYNKLKGNWAGQKQNFNEKNEAVIELFGNAGNGVKELVAGKVYINDIFIDGNLVNKDKIFNHVAIDRFTGGAMDGALFSEKVSYLKEGSLMIDIFVDEVDDSEKQQALELALEDVCKGTLPLGGMTTKGHGIFTGKLTKNGKTLFNYE